VRADQKISDHDRMSLHVGPPLNPPKSVRSSGRGALREWHETIMKEISRLSGKKMES